MGKFKQGLEDFKKFAMRGNVLDLAIGVIVGGAFGKIVTSLVNDIVMPVLGLLIGAVNLKDLYWEIRAASEVPKMDALVLKYGMFLQNIVDFLIITVSIYLVIKLVEQLRRKQEEAQAKELEQALAEQQPAAPPRSEVLLEEILEELKKQNRQETEPR